MSKTSYTPYMDFDPVTLISFKAKDYNSHLLKALIQARTNLNWTQAELSRRTGIAQSEISKIECGRQSPTLATFSLLASVLFLSVSVVIRPPATS